MRDLRSVSLQERFTSKVKWLFCLLPVLVIVGCGSGMNGNPESTPATVSLSANPTSIAAGSSATLTATAANATQVVITGSDGSRYTLASNGGPQNVSPSSTTTYTATASGFGGSASATATVTVTANPVTVTLSASPSSVTAGESSILTAVATNATQVVITGSDGSTYTLSPTGGTQSVTPSATTTYTATATGAAGKATANTVLTVVAIPVTSVTLSANPASITAGGSSQLTATAANATGVVITGSDGSRYTLAATGGTQSVTPSSTTTYTATASGLAGNAMATATVTVTANPAATVTLTASPASIAPGASSVLAASATNATGVVITGSDGSSYTLSPTGGTQSVTPSATTTYTATATGAGGNASASATVTVSAKPVSVTLNANPTSISSGGSSTLTATATNATGVVITGSDGSRYTLSSTGGAQSVSPSSTTTYTATATGAGGNATATATVSVAASPATVTLSASPASISSGGSSTLTATATNSTGVVITGSDGSSYTLSATGGTQVVSPSATTTYTATATGAGGNATATATVSVAANPATVTLSANPTSISAGGSSVLTATATNATKVVITGSDGSSYTLSATGGSQTVTPTSTTVYTATASGTGANATATATVTVVGDLKSINHVIFLLQENRSFDSYFGMLNNYRSKNGFTQGDDGKTYAVDGIEDKLTKISNQTDDGTSSFSPFKLATSCVDDMSSSWLESYGDVSRYDFTLARPIVMDGFVHTAENFAKNCFASDNKGCAAAKPFTDLDGRRAMGYYDESFLNYYYYMASQFALSDRWFSPVSSKSVPNRIATFTGGTTQGLVFDPGNDDQLPQLGIHTIFEELTQKNVSWKIYYTVTQGACLDYDDCPADATASYPATNFSFLSESYKYLHSKPTGGACAAPTQPSSVVGDKTNSFCIDPTHIAPLSQYFTDVTNGTLPSFAFIEAGYGVNDEHPGNGQSILSGQQQVAKLANALMGSKSWKDSVFFVAYDEGGGPYDHVPPVQGHSNDFTDPMVGSTPVTNIPDILSISVNPDTFYPCTYSGTPTTNCDLRPMNPGTNDLDAAHIKGFAAQLGFRIPNMVISPFVKKHYVSHVPMDHTAILKFVEDRFIGSSTYLTKRDEAQPNLTDFFDFTGAPWLTPPTPPTPVSPATLGYDPCKSETLGP